MRQSYHEHIPLWAKKLLPSNIRLLSGPGCPVCVTPTSYIDTAIAISQKYSQEVLITTFGDLFRAPGSSSSLEREKARGASVIVVYSTLDALEVAKKMPEKGRIPGHWF